MAFSDSIDVIERVVERAALPPRPMPCVTHHHACDCRERMFADLAEALDLSLRNEARLRESLRKLRDEIGMIMGEG